MSCELLLRINGPLNKNFLRNDFSVRMHASHINTHTTSVNVGEFQVIGFLLLDSISGHFLIHS